MLTESGSKRGWFEGRGRMISGTLAAVVLLLSAAAIVWYVHANRRLPDAEVVRDFFVDEETLIQSRHTAYEIPPLPGQDGRPTVVIAVYCRPEDQTEPTLHFLWKYPPDVKAELDEDMKAHGGRRTDEQLWIGAYRKRLVRRPAAGSPWLDISTPEAQAVIAMPFDAQGRSAWPYLPQ